MTARSCAGRDGGGPRPMVPWTPAVRVLPSGEGVAGRCAGGAAEGMPRSRCGQRPDYVL